MQKLRDLSSLPIYPWMFATYPALQLAAHNIREVSLDETLRPLLASWLIASAGFGLMVAILRRTHLSALVLLFGLIFLFTYGHAYQYLRENPLMGLGRHRYLLALYAIALALGVWIAFRSSSRLRQAAPWLNTLALALVIIPVAQIIEHQLQASTTRRGASQSTAFEQPAPREGDLPDIYYIILDTYTRGDALARDYGYDNSGFLAELTELGFYVADCSRSNYGETLGSLTSALNMNYLPQVQGRLTELGLDPKNVFVLLKQNFVRSQLEALGYKTVAFQTGFDWTNWRDADIYVSLAEAPLDIGRFSPFEVLFIETTAAKVLLDSQYLLRIANVGEADFRYGAHVELQLHTLEELSKVHFIEEPTFTFAHLLIPHTPLVFTADGGIVSDPGYYSGEKSGPVNREYLIRGYTNEITFINQRMLEIVATLISESVVRPVIVIQGDTGLEADNKMQILNAYYAPLAEDQLYPTISPVNTFRALFNAYLGSDYERLPDISYPYGDAQPSEPETAPNCINR